MTDEIKSFYPRSREEWRKWLEENHKSEKNVWLIFYKKASNMPTVEYSDTVDEALCFGWIDSKIQPIDSQKYRRLFSVRKPKSVWSRVNKLKLEKLIEQNLIQEAGFESIETAKKNGSWLVLDEVEDLTIPPDLEAKFNENVAAKSYFETLSRTNKRNILQWLVLAKRAETRKKRIEEIIDLAAQQKKPKQFETKKDI
jgi:uncharacterized protein YdeI (YjbR/CyaY-like superfamily)